MYEELVRRLRRYVEIERSEHHGAELEAEAADAIEELDKLLNGVSADNDSLCEKIERMVIAGKPRWIPVAERLPEEDTEVLISYRYKEGEGNTDHVNIDITSYGTVCFGGREIHTLKEWRQPFDYFHVNYEVIAWMPLPEPPKEEA